MNTRLSLFILGGALCLLPANRATAAPLDSAQQACLQAAERHDKAGWVYLHVEGAPRDRGFQHGYLLAREIAEGLRMGRRNWEYQSAKDWAWFVETAGAMCEPKIDAENLAELDGIVEGLRAAGVEATRRELIVYNGWCELVWYWWSGELKKIKDAPPRPVRQSCSSFIATGRMTRDGNVVLGHNSMCGYTEMWPNVVLDLQPQQGHRILMQTCPGWIHSGTDFFVTDAGLVGSETTIGGFDGFDTNGVPEFVRMRRATQDAGSIEEWCAVMQRGNNGGYANAWLLGDIHSRAIARLELGLKHAGFEKKQDGCFLGSNVAEDLQILRFETDSNEVDIRASSVARRVRWKQLMREYAGRIDLEAAKLFEADHYDPYLRKTRPASRSLCGHFELEDQPAPGWPGAPYVPSGTLDGKVVDATLAARMSFVARWGAACGRPFDASKFLARHPQFDWMTGLLKDRASEPWVVFAAGEKGR